MVVICPASHLLDLRVGELVHADPEAPRVEESLPLHLLERQDLWECRKIQSDQDATPPKAHCTLRSSSSPSSVWYLARASLAAWVISTRSAMVCYVFWVFFICAEQQNKQQISNKIIIIFARPPK